MCPFDEMESRGVVFKQAEPEEYLWGISAMFSDPYENTFWIAQHTARAPSWKQAQGVGRKGLEDPVWFVLG